MSKDTSAVPATTAYQNLAYGDALITIDGNAKKTLLMGIDTAAGRNHYLRAGVLEDMSRDPARTMDEIDWVLTQSLTMRPEGRLVLIINGLKMNFKELLSRRPHSDALSDRSEESYTTRFMGMNVTQCLFWTTVEEYREIAVMCS